MITELTADALHRTCDPETLGCETTAELPGAETMIGQERAVRALRFGLGMRDAGFNIYAAGLPGTGRTTAVKRFLEDLAEVSPPPPDWCYVNNFGDPYRPSALRLPSGTAGAFKRELGEMMASVRAEIRAVFEGEEYAAQREGVMRSFQQQSDELIRNVSEQAQNAGFTIQASSMGLVAVPMREGRPLTEETYAALSAEEREEIARRRDEIQGALEAATRQARGLGRSAQGAVEKLDRQVAHYAIGHLVEALQARYAELPALVDYLSALQDDVLDHLDRFRRPPQASKSDEESAAAQDRAAAERFFRRYEVNVVVDNAGLEGAPVVIETNPTYANLFGRVEQEAVYGALVTDFTMVRAGSLHRANGGYLVLQAIDLVRDGVAWESLKRALANREVAIEEVAERYGFAQTKSLRPEPIPLDVKVILIGQPQTYYLLRAADEAFGELFKVKADFDTQMDRTPDNVRAYGSFVATLCEEEGLTHLDAGALARLVAHGSRMAGDREKLSTRFGEIADVLREANHYATVDGAPFVNATHLDKAIEEHRNRSGLVPDRIREMIARDTIKIDVEGSRVGQVNGLSVVALGDISFGQPNRITASVGLGVGGVVDIEREAQTGGPLHTKGVLILSGFLTERFARDKPLSLSAHLVFEQNYGGVEGDSASSAELYALLSSLADLPINQGIAVTGSVNQKGEVQAIGGVNEKIEGFYRICEAKGLTGDQGVIIPAANVANLMLRDEVVAAVGEGRFHVWAVDAVDEGIEILTGVPAGRRDETGAFVEGTVNARADRRLRELAEAMRGFIGLRAGPGLGT